MMIRAFFGIDLPLELKNRISDLINDLKKSTAPHPIRWVKPERLHITLQFIKQLNTLDIPNLIERMGAELKTITPFTLNIGSFELFSTFHHSTVISLTVEPHEAVSHCSSALGQGITRLGYPPETRPFHPHITLGRTHVSPQPFTPPKIEPSLHEAIFVNEIVLFQSEPRAERSRYTPLRHIPLDSLCITPI